MISYARKRNEEQITHEKRYTNEQFQQQQLRRPGKDCLSLFALRFWSNLITTKLAWYENVLLRRLENRQQPEFSWKWGKESARAGGVRVGAGGGTMLFVANLVSHWISHILHPSTQHRQKLRVKLRGNMRKKFFFLKLSLALCCCRCVTRIIFPCKMFWILKLFHSFIPAHTNMSLKVEGERGVGEKQKADFTPRKCSD